MIALLIKEEQQQHGHEQALEREVDGPSLRGKAVADLRHGLDEVAAPSELLAQVLDVRVEAARLDGAAVRGGVLDEELPRQRLARVAEQEEQHLELARLQLERRAVDLGDAGLGVHAQPARLHGAAGARAGAVAAQDGLDAREQLHRAERLDDVVVGAEVQREHLVSLARHARQHDDGDAAGRGVGAQGLQDDAAVPARQAHVEQDQVGLGVHGLAEGLRRVGHVPRGEARPEGQGLLDGLDDLGIVLDDQHARHGPIIANSQIDHKQYGRSSRVSVTLSPCADNPFPAPASR
ncbi:MAG: hypothetical protein M0D55_15675 [Elusimicrobiota bacterium]|nr:MAG: hypothetical protein M0D55_15675 [Elusimicrobiota bacterium]